MKTRCLIMGATANYAFTIANVLQGVQKYNAHVFTKIIIFHQGFESKDQKLCQKIIDCEFREYQFEWKNTTKRGGGYTNPTFSRYEAFKLLAEYEEVLWLDCDIIVQKDLSGVFDIGNSGFSVARDDSLVCDYFTEPISGYNFFTLGWQSGVMVVNRKLKNADQIYAWLYEKTEEYGHLQLLLDQAILNLAIQNFKIKVHPMVSRFFNCPPYDDHGQAAIVHCWGISKPWINYLVYSQYPQWGQSHKNWIAMGGREADVFKNDSADPYLTKLQGSGIDELFRELNRLRAASLRGKLSRFIKTHCSYLMDFRRYILRKIAIFSKKNSKY